MLKRHAADISCLQLRWKLLVKKKETTRIRRWELFVCVFVVSIQHAKFRTFFRPFFVSRFFWFLSAQWETRDHVRLTRKWQNLPRLELRIIHPFWHLSTTTQKQKSLSLDHLHTIPSNIESHDWKDCLRCLWIWLGPRRLSVLSKLWQRLGSSRKWDSCCNGFAYRGTRSRTLYCYIWWTDEQCTIAQNSNTDRSWNDNYHFCFFVFSAFCGQKHALTRGGQFLCPSHGGHARTCTSVRCLRRDFVFSQQYAWQVYHASRNKRGKYIRCHTDWCQSSGLCSRCHDDSCRYHFGIPYRGHPCRRSGGSKRAGSAWAIFRSQTTSCICFGSRPGPVDCLEWCFHSWKCLCQSQRSMSPLDDCFMIKVKKRCEHGSAATPLTSLLKLCCST